MQYGNNPSAEHVSRVHTEIIRQREQRARRDAERAAREASTTLSISVELRDGDDLLDFADRIRESLARAVAEGRDSGVVRDENGTSVGTWTAVAR